MGVFRFKQFSVNDDGCTMKVGTDAVLLGAWCEVEHAKRILDIGTGSGVIALMMAQRSEESARVDAVEIQDEDARQAEVNVTRSPWPDKVQIFQKRVQEFNPGYVYDLIVCNPPYFSNSLLPPDTRRTHARHGTELTHDELVKAVARLLGPEGAFSVILPAKESASFIGETEQHGLFLRRLTHFHSRREKPEERSLMMFGRLRTPWTEDTLILYEKDQIQSTRYQQLTGGFYL